MSKSPSHPLTTSSYVVNGRHSGACHALEPCFSASRQHCKRSKTFRSTSSRLWPPRFEAGLRIWPNTKDAMFGASACWTIVFNEMCDCMPSVVAFLPSSVSCSSHFASTVLDFKSLLSSHNSFSLMMPVDDK